MKARLFLAVLAAVSLVTPAAAQSFNIDFGSSRGDHRTAGTRGYWNSLRTVGATVDDLVDVDGLLTPVSMNAGPYFDNLMNGTYEVTTYASTGSARRIVDVEEGRLDAPATIRGIQVRLLDGRAPLFMTAADLTWLAALASPRYDVVSGDLSTLHSTGGDFTAATTSCHAEDLASRQVDHFGTPPAGEGFWYLNRGVTDVTPLTYDAGSRSQVGDRDVEIDLSAAACN